MKYPWILAATAVMVACGGNNRRQAPASGEAATATAEAVPAAPDMHTAETSLDYFGTYSGTLPGADCPGIETTLTLTSDGKYTLHMKYLERNVEFDEAGTYAVQGNLLTLTPAGSGQPGYYKVEENRLRHLDADRQPITGDLAEHYVLHKKQ